MMSRNGTLRMARWQGALAALALTLGTAVPVWAAPAQAAAAKAQPVAKKTVAPARDQTRKAYSASEARARRARLARARAAARASELREAQTPRFRIDELGREVPDVRAEAAIVYNPDTHEVLWESNAQAQRSIASITKVMTAIVAFDSGLDPARKVKIVRGDVSRASTTYLRAGYTVTVDDLMHLLLVGSDNAAARAVARVSPYGSAGFVEQMNERAREMGLDATRYADPSGLLAANESSAYDQARLIAYAAADERVASIMRKAQHTVRAGRRAITVNSTNQLVKTGEFDVLGGKTGFISRAGYCLATLLRLPDTGRQVAVVVLGARSNAGRFWETRHLANWITGRARSLLAAPSDQQPHD